MILVIKKYKTCLTEIVRHVFIYSKKTFIAILKMSFVQNTFHQVNCNKIFPLLSL